MRSSTGEYYVGLDHVRALAAFLVFAWHFLNTNTAPDVPLAGTFDFFAFSIFAEGHTGVSLFMVLSGYLFAKITRKRPLDYTRFFRARAFRLLPLLLAVVLIVIVIDYLRIGPEAAMGRISDTLWGVIYPTLPNGGWSITVEVHFYLIFPVMLIMERRFPFSSLIFVAAGFLIRIIILHTEGAAALQDAAYWTILGRIDQFVLGILVAYYFDFLARRHWVAGLAAVSVLGLYAVFDHLGGFYANTAFPQIWVFMLTAEGLLYAILIGWYDQSFRFRDTGISGLIAKVGAASYSIYLLHVFFVFRLARLIHNHVIALDNFYVAFVACVICFIPVAAISWLSYRYYELWWMRFRKPYIEKPPVDAKLTASASGGPG